MSDCLQLLAFFIDQCQPVEVFDYESTARADSEKHFLDIFETNPFPLLVFDKKGLVIKVNQAFSSHAFFKKIFPATTIAEVCIAFSCHKKMLNDFQRALELSVVDGECECLLNFYRTDIALPPFWRYRFLQVGQKNNLIILLELQDVYLHSQVHYFQEIFQKLFHSVKKGLCVIDAKENIVFINTFLSQQILHLDENFQGQLFREVFAIKNWYLAFHKPLALTLKRPSMPEPKTILLSASAFNDVYPLTLLSFVDISEQKTREIELMQLAKMGSLEFFACGLSHDFNNIITIIKGNVDFLLTELKDDKEIMALLNDTLSAVEEGQQVIQRLLKFVRGYNETLANYRLKDILKTLQLLLKHVFPKEINLLWNEDSIDSSVEVSVNLSCFDNALLNLFINARQSLVEKFTGDKLAEAKISFAAEIIRLDKPTVLKSGIIESGKYAVLSVLDNGLGMNETLKNKILTPFYTTKQGGEWSWLVHGIVLR